MAFDLYITFAGLCLFSRRKEAGKEVLYVLLPDVKHVHVNGQPMEPHRAVVGYHARYHHSTPSPKTLVPGKNPHFKEHNLNGHDLDLSGIESKDSLKPELDHMDVVRVPKITPNRPEPAKALSKVVLRAGRACPTELCEPNRGAQWELTWPENGNDVTICQYMATMVHWRICNVTSAEGKDEFTLRTSSKEGGLNLATLRPDGRGRIRIYLFHTPKDELPSAGPPPFKKLKPEASMEHFEAYYSLYGVKDGPVPVLALQCGTDAALMSDPLAPPAKRERLFLGRLSTCAVAQEEA